MEMWTLFWTVLCAVGFISFFLMFVIVVPRGAVELKELFAHLDSERDTVHPDAKAPAENGKKA